jgi:hypothetical protein
MFDKIEKNEKNGDGTGKRRRQTKNKRCYKSS